MNQLISFELSEFSILWVVFFGLGLSLVFRIIRRFIILKFVQNRNLYIYDLLEIALWMIYVFVAIKIVLKDSLYYMVAVFSFSAIILIWIGWFVARDFIAGIVLKFGGNFQVGQQFSMDNIKGNIISANFLHLEILQSNGMVTKIPYHKISASIHSETQPGDRSVEYRFVVTIGNVSNLDVTREDIRNTILLTPGVAISKEPQILLKQHDEKSSTLEIIAYLIHGDYSDDVLNNVRKLTGENT